jgi:putative PIN family toxin of toxin-antitoxin system
MTRVVIDTNIIVSAYLNQEGLPFFILKLALAGNVRLCASEDILSEYQELLQRKSLPLNIRRAKLLFRSIRRASEIVTPASRVNATADPDDNIFLECAQAAKAHYLVTGNTAHFPSRWKYTKVITPRTFIDIWKDLRPGDHSLRER